MSKTRRLLGLAEGGEASEKTDEIPSEKDEEAKRKRAEEDEWWRVMYSDALLPKHRQQSEAAIWTGGGS